jgi:hypothetical protein
MLRQIAIFGPNLPPEIVPKTNPRRRSSTAKTRQKIALGNAVKPFGNSQKGIGNGRLTWLTASDKYARHR